MHKLKDSNYKLGGKNRLVDTYGCERCGCSSEFDSSRDRICFCDSCYGIGCKSGWSTFIIKEVPVCNRITPHPFNKALHKIVRKQHRKNITRKVVPYKFNNNPKFLKFNLKQLPRQLHNRIYIRCMKEFWKKYVPLTGQVLPWHVQGLKQHRLIYESIQQNIHFLHLPCNTLDEYKKYIPGCQCNSCKKKTHLALTYNKDKFIRNQILESDDFEAHQKLVPESSHIFTNNYIFDKNSYIINDGFVRFDPAHDHPDHTSLRKELLSDKLFEFTWLP